MHIYMCVCMRCDPSADNPLARSLASLLYFARRMLCSLKYQNSNHGNSNPIICFPRKKRHHPHHPYPHLTPSKAPSASCSNTFLLIAFALTDTNPTSATPTTNPKLNNMTFTGPGSPLNVSWNR